MAAETVVAHHGSAPFDTQARATFEGVITEFDYRNPHSLIYIESADAAGNPVEAMVEATGATSRHFGLTADALSPGDRIIAVVNPSRREPTTWGLGVEIIKDDGTVVPLSGRYAEYAENRNTGTATSLAGVWVPRSEDFFGYVLSRSSLVLTEKGRSSRQSWDISRSSQAECVPYPPPVLMLYSAVNVIEVLDDRVLIHSEWMGGEREIHLRERGPDEAPAPALHGHSVGRWEDGVLVVETTGFSENNSGIGTGYSSGPRKRMIERFALLEDGSGIDYSFTLEDPDYLAEPVSDGSRWDYRPDLELDDRGCDLDSARRYLTE